MPYLVSLFPKIQGFMPYNRTPLFARLEHIYIYIYIYVVAGCCQCFQILCNKTNPSCAFVCWTLFVSVGNLLALSGPLNRLSAILSLLHPLDCYRTPSAIGSAIGKALSHPISHPNTGGSPQPPRSKPLGGSTAR